ncbi:hypothetical protein MASR1M31_04300 [Porphyromonadaceae bacterium]
MEVINNSMMPIDKGVMPVVSESDRSGCEEINFIVTKVGMMNMNREEISWMIRSMPVDTVAVSEGTNHNNAAEIPPAKRVNSKNTTAAVINL